MRGLIGRALITALVGCLLAASAQADEAEAIPGEYVVKLKTGLRVQSLNVNALSRALGSYVKSTIPDLNMVVVKRPVMELRKTATKALNANPYVQYAEPNYVYRVNRTPNDPLLTNLWGIKNTGAPDSSGGAGIAGIDVGAEAAWDIQTGSDRVLVAVIDTGVKYDHADLVENIWTNQAEANGKPGVDDDGNGYVDDLHGYDFSNNDGDPMDDHGHGSHCSGTIGARGNDGKGIVGVAWNVKIMGVKFLGGDGSGSLEGAVKSIDYATKMGAKILSNSWGGGGYSEALKEAIARSNAAGALFVAAAGNESNNNDSRPTYPNSYDVPNILSVAAIRNNGTLASFSNYGRNKVHVGAPGVNVYSITTAGYESWSGTSMATPHVSGIAALLAANEPNMTGVELKNRIVQTARPIAGLRGKVRSGGLANAYLALTNTRPEPDQNDPSNWQAIEVKIESAHPYADKFKGSYEVRVPGARQIALYFSKFQTEANYDILVIKDKTGKVIDRLSGTNDESFSSTIDGDLAILEFTTDESLNYHGFEISKAAYR